MDICYTSTVIPELVRDLLSEKNTIAFGDCMMQLFTMQLFDGVEVFILVGMAYDRYIAICKSLQYMVIMNKQQCATEVEVRWGGGFLHFIVQYLLVIYLPFYGPNKIDHYFIDVYPLLELVCSVTDVPRQFRDNCIDLICSFGLLLCHHFSQSEYPLFGRTAQSPRYLRFPHHHAGPAFLDSCIFIYLRPTQTFPEDKVFALIYTITAPRFNSFIYTLSNKNGHEEGVVL
ncbi:olfactory receptor 4P4-like [Tachyglossus aculeatus]|uniref:olfactory receptor 4P4-like n=1 Tax=Tachyglossus aculeatus TaxID=9261 RepID=UPI0018F705AA|nr:olfactory receptor 4P4-like [Tachyglossus aculeatus]